MTGEREGGCHCAEDMTCSNVQVGWLGVPVIAPSFCRPMNSTVTLKFCLIPTHHFVR